MPAALRRDHRVADRTWAVLRVLAGSVVLDLDTSPPFERRVEAGEDQPIPPDVIHRLRPSSLVRLEIDFLVANRA